MPEHHFRGQLYLYLPGTERTVIGKEVAPGPKHVFCYVQSKMSFTPSLATFCHNYRKARHLVYKVIDPF